MVDMVSGIDFSFAPKAIASQLIDNTIYSQPSGSLNQDIVTTISISKIYNLSVGGVRLYLL